MGTFSLSGSSIVPDQFSSVAVPDAPFLQQNQLYSVPQLNSSTTNSQSEVRDGQLRRRGPDWLESEGEEKLRLQHQLLGLRGDR